MRSRVAFLAAAVTSAVPFVLGACRDGTTPPEPVPAASTSAAVTAAPVCPPQPEWAPPPADEAHVVAEILFQPAEAGGRKGTGMRITDAPFATAYDELLITVENGKVKSDPVPGMWRPKGPVAPRRLEELRKLIDSLDPADLSEWQGRERRGSKRPSFLRVRRSDGTWLRGCWRGNDGSTGQQRIEELIKTIVGEAGEAAAAAASASAKSKGVKLPQGARFE